MDPYEQTIFHFYFSVSRAEVSSKSFRYFFVQRFLSASLTTCLIQKFMQNITFLLGLTLLIKVLQEQLKFNYVCIIFFK